MVRIIFASGPARSALLLPGGDKAGNWQWWYRDNIPLAEQMYRYAFAADLDQCGGDPGESGLADGGDRQRDGARPQADEAVAAGLRPRPGQEITERVGSGAGHESSGPDATPFRGISATL